MTKSVRQKGFLILITVSALLLAFDHTVSFAGPELLKYEVTWNGAKAGHGDITTVRDSKHVKVVAQAVSDGMLKTLFEMWSRVQAVFSVNTFKPQWYQFHLKTSLGNPEIVNLAFDHKSNLVQVDKQKGSEKESHAEKFSGLYDPITAIFLLRSMDCTRPAQVDIYDGKDKSRLCVSFACNETINTKVGAYPASCLNLRLVKLGGDGREIGTGKLWVSNDQHRIPLRLTSCPVVGTVQFELVQAQM
jgi:hypothetical protein